MKAVKHNGDWPAPFSHYNSTDNVSCVLEIFNGQTLLL